MHTVDFFPSSKKRDARHKFLQHRGAHADFTRNSPKNVLGADGLVTPVDGRHLERQVTQSQFAA